MSEDFETIRFKDINRGRLGDYTYQFVDTGVTSVSLMKNDDAASHNDPLLDLEIDLDEVPETYDTRFDRVLTDAEKQHVVRIMGNNIGDLDRVKAEVFKYKLSLK